MLATQSALCFVHSSHPADIAAQKKRIRSHAAKNAVMRQQRVANYQNAKAKRSLVAGADSVEPGLSLAATINSPVAKFERFLLHHFVVHVIGQAVTCIPFGTVPSTLDMRRDISTLWMQMAVVDRGVAAALFLNACRHLIQHTQQEKYHALILKYKGECIGDINLSLSKQGNTVADVTIVKTLILASDAISHGDKHAAKWHLRAASIMINSRGGLQGIASNGTLGKLLVWILKDPIHKSGALVGPNCLASVFTRQSMKLNQAQNNPIT